jgi:hypothetical protein
MRKTAYLMLTAGFLGCVVWAEADLKYDLAVGGNSVIKAGTLIYGKVQSATQARRAVGQSTLDLRLTQLVVNGKPLPITSSGYMAARGAAAGAASKPCIILLGAPLAENQTATTNMEATETA